MTVAFYAPLKSPNALTPSGDRQIARNFIDALGRIGETVVLASELRTFEGLGDRARQRSLQQAAAFAARQILEKIRTGEMSRPRLWFTYHCYHKAPDCVGPIVSAELGIPYVIAEASISPKHANGPWQLGHQAACSAVARADLVLGLNPRDAACVTALMKPGAAYRTLPPFIDTRLYREALPHRAHFRQIMARQFGVDRDKVWLLAVAMMRAGDKLSSYLQLAEALELIDDPRWHLFAVGSGDARDKVVQRFAGFADRVSWFGSKSPEDMPEIYRSMDILTWPAINEALGIVFLEAGACGLPVVAGHTDGVASIVRDKATGLLAPYDDPAGFAETLRALLNSPPKRGVYGGAAVHHVQNNHSFDAACGSLKSALALLAPVSAA